MPSYGLIWKIFQHKWTAKWWSPVCIVDILSSLQVSIAYTLATNLSHNKCLLRTSIISEVLEESRDYSHCCFLEHKGQEVWVQIVFWHLVEMISLQQWGRFLVALAYDMKVSIDAADCSCCSSIFQCLHGFVPDSRGYLLTKLLYVKNTLDLGFS